MDPTSGGNLRLDQTGINCYMSTTLAKVYAESPTHKLWLDLLIVLLLHFYYYAVTYIIILNVLWTEGVSEINY